MKQSLKELTNYQIETKDGKTGRVKDFLFDEKLWVIRYLEADFGGLFSSEKVLIPRVFLKQPEQKDKHFPTQLMQDDIDKCPGLSAHLPVSRKYEEELHKHYQLNPYWSSAHLGNAGYYFPPRPVNIPDKTLDEANTDSILRSFEEIRGYHIISTDGKIGHIEDIIVDDEDWQIIYVVVDTSNWLPLSKKVLVAVDWMTRISYVAEEVTLKLTTDSIKNAPEFNPAVVLDEDYEKGLFDFYSSSLIK